jgi:hypothetical protein
MATSGVTTYKLSRDAMIESALKLVGVHTKGSTLTAEMLNDAIVSLNLILKSLDAIPNIKWFSSGVSTPITATGAASYSLAAIDAWVDAIDYVNGATLCQLIELDMAKWRNIRSKALVGTPKYYFVENDDDTATKQVFFHPNPASGTLNYWPRRRIEIVTAKADEFDIPEELQGLIRYWLAYIQAVYYGVPQDRLSAIQQLFSTELSLTLPEQANLISRSLANSDTIHEKNEKQQQGGLQ